MNFQDGDDPGAPTYRDMNDEELEDANRNFKATQPKGTKKTMAGGPAANDVSLKGKEHQAVAKTANMGAAGKMTKNGNMDN